LYAARADRRAASNAEARACVTRDFADTRFNPSAKRPARCTVHHTAGVRVHDDTRSMPGHRNGLHNDDVVTAVFSRLWVGRDGSDLSLNAVAAALSARSVAVWA